jgi:hypothetical protein
VSKKYPKVTNHWTGKPLGKKANKTLHEAYEARQGARKMARSGHPGRRAEGVKGVRDITDFIRGIYITDAREQMG